MCNHGLACRSGTPKTTEDRTRGNATSGQVEPILLRLKDAQVISGFSPLNDFLRETQAIFENFVEAKHEKEKNKFYTEGYDRLQKMNSLIIGE